MMNDIPEIYQNIYRKAMTGKSLRAAVNARCLDCCCWQRTEVRDCPAENCPLYPYRPYQDKSSKENRDSEQGFSDSEGRQDGGLTNE